MDDSGSERSGIASFSWLELADRDWSVALGRWFDYRDELWRHHGVGKAVEIHSTSFANGRGRPSVDEAFNASKKARRDAFRRGIEAMASLPGLGVGTVYGRTRGRHGDYRSERMRVYGQLVRVLDERAARDGGHVLVVMDGDGTDTGYITAHRALRLRTRRVLEDPLFQPSDRSQWLQMADMVAYSAYQEVLGHPSMAFAHGWYPRLRGIDVGAGPLEV